MAGGGIDYLAENTLVFVIIIIILVLIISAIIAWQFYRLCGRYCKSEIQCRKKLSPCVESAAYPDGSSDAGYAPPRPGYDCGQRSSENDDYDVSWGSPEGITSVHTDDLLEDDVSRYMSRPHIVTPPVCQPPPRYLSPEQPLSYRIHYVATRRISIDSLEVLDIPIDSIYDEVETREYGTNTNLPNELGTIHYPRNISQLTTLTPLVPPRIRSPRCRSSGRQTPSASGSRAYDSSRSTRSYIEQVYDDAPTTRVGAETSESVTTELTNLLNELHTANDDTHSVGSDHQLTDSDLQELMVPDMNESVVKEVRSKPIMFISKRIDEKGGTLVLDNMGIFLTVPPGAIEPGEPEIIFLALNWDLRDLPQMTPNQTIVSPVIQVGPHGLKLKRQATLSFGHCAFNANQVKVYSSETHLMQDKEWCATIGDEDGGTSSHRVLDKECQVYLSHFTLFTCIAEGEAVKKWLQVAAFGKMIGSQFEIRIHLLNDTPSALQFAVENEKKFHYEQMKIPQEYLFCDDMTNMILKVESISEGWSSNVEEMQEEIPFLSIWHGKSPFASFVFKMLNRETEEINTTISARQGDGSKLQLKLLKEIRQKDECTKGRIKESGDGGLELMASSKGLGFFQGVISEDYVPCSHEDRQMTSPVLPWRDTGSFHLSSQARRALTSPRNSTHVIPHKLKMKLVELMDPLKAAGNDWRMIASELGVDSKIDFLGMQNSPFLEVLGIMQGMKKDLGWLKETLILHERIDAVDVITQYLETTGSD